MDDLVNDVDDTATLWRYMDLSKFLDLILHKKLVFPRYDKFEDTFEGYAANFIELVRKGLYSINESDESIINFVTGILTDVVSVYNYYTYVSCWHLNEFESAGMWKLYCKSPESLVIKTKVHLLKESLKPKDNHEIVYSKVTYDSKLENIQLMETSNINPHTALLMKRESFDHEKEYRLLLIDNNYKDEREALCIEIQNSQVEDHKKWKGINIQKINELSNKEQTADIKKQIQALINEIYEYKNKNIAQTLENLKNNKASIISVDIEPNDLIEEIIVSPHAPKWFLNTLQKLISELGFKFRVSQSNLYDLK